MGAIKHLICIKNCNTIYSMFGFGISELLIIFFIILILFGAKKIPELGSGLGEGIKNFTKSFKDPGTDAKKKSEVNDESSKSAKSETKV